MKTEINIATGFKIMAVSGLLMLSACDQNKTTTATTSEAATFSQPFDNKEFTVPSQEELREKLTPLQYKVTQKEGTEPPFNNEYWDNKEPGIYVDIVSGEPLFSSVAKYESGTGWPSFSAPLEPANIVEHEDRTLWMTRTEVRSKHADSHLGHVFPDGPAPTGLRYCMNSASMRFVPASKLKEEGYENYAKLFESKTPKENSDS